MSSWSSGDEDEVEMSKRDRLRAESALHKAGYRDGIEKGKEENLQKYFDELVEVKSDFSKKYGKLHGILMIFNSKSDLKPETANEVIKIESEILSALEFNDYKSCEDPPNSISEEQTDFQFRIKGLRDKWEEVYGKIERQIKSIFPEGFK